MDDSNTVVKIGYLFLFTIDANEFWFVIAIPVFVDNPSKLIVTLKSIPVSSKLETLKNLKP